MPNGASTGLFAETDGGVFLSTNNDTSRTAVSTDLTNTVVNVLAVSGTNLFAGTYGGSVWGRPLLEIVTSADEITGGALPVSFELKQNYPNPFNPSTVISCQSAVK
jgi:hypothetical protein